MPSDLPELKPLTAFGRSRADVSIIAVQLEEWAHANPIRSFRLRLDRDEATLVETLHEIPTRVFQADRGTVYCLSGLGQLRILDRGRWTTERVCDADEEFNDLFGFSGTTLQEDQIFVVSNTGLFVRRAAGRWETYAIPEGFEVANCIHGLRPDELYIGVDGGLVRWDGRTLAPVEGPDDEVIALLVRSEEEMLAVGNEIHRWTEAEGWTALESPVEGLAAGLLTFQNDVYLASFEGILRADGLDFKRVDPFPCNGLVAVGDILLAMGRDSGLAVLEHGRWSRIRLPRLARGGTLP
jgi:hypothetical protein